MSRIIILDSGPLGMAVHPTAKGVAQQCQAWLDKLLRQGERIAIPEIADYEVRRELLRAVFPNCGNQLISQESRFSHSSCQIRYAAGMEDKPINWIGTSKDEVGSSPDEARRKAGFQLRRVQRGEAQVDFKPMPTIGKGVQEIRIRTEDAYRIFYVAKFDEAVYVLHAFQKKTQKTSQQDINIGQQRYQQMIQDRESQLQENSHE